YVLNRKPLSANQVERVRLTPQGMAGHLKEIAFLDGERVIPVKTIYSMENGSQVPATQHPLFDEAQKVTEKPSNLNSTYFDEIYHGRTAYEFVKKSAVYETTHPPLGKDILALGVLMFGMNPFGMRVMHALIGICFIIALFFLGRQILATRFGAYATMLAGFFDFMPLVQSRYSTIDTTSVLFITLMLIFTFKYIREQLQPVKGRNSWATIALVILFYALGADVKWTAHYGFVGVVVCVAVVKIQQYLALRRGRGSVDADPKNVVKTSREKKQKTPSGLSVNPIKAFWYRNFGFTVIQWLALFLLIAPLVYYLAYIPFLHCQQIDEVFSSEAFTQVIENQKGMYNYHSQLTATHPFSSTWWSWPFNFKPLWIYTGGHTQAGFKGSIVSMGNPVIWFLGWIAVLILFYQVLVNRKFSLLHLVFIALFSLYLPWVLVTRATFIYHFFPVLPLYYILGVMVLEPLWQMGKSGRQVVWGVATLAVVLWLMFYPALTGLEVPEKYIQTLRWFPRDWIF
ncbi:MAG TPA: glycosyltransferase family 39 protein, partial [Bacillota bacterium]|nr:glycosyltransferase family 39 protein [Bacillota bacterium]